MTQVTITYDDAEWQLVPKAPTVDMLEEVCLIEGFSQRALISRYNAMLAAAPQPPQSVPAPGTMSDGAIEDLILPLMLRHMSGKLLHYATYTCRADEPDRPVTAMRTFAQALLAHAAVQADGPAITADVHRDAERYLKLRDQDWNTSQLFVVAGGRECVKLGVDCPSRERLDEMVDAMPERGAAPCTNCGLAIDPKCGCARGRAIAAREGEEKS